MKKYNVKKVVSLLGTALMILSFVFIGTRLVQYDIDFTMLSSPWVIAGFLMVSVSIGLFMLFAARNFGWIVEDLTGIHIDSGLILPLYCLANLYKYIPGSVMYVIGRNRLAVESDEVSHSQVVVSTVAEGVLIAIAAVSLVVLSVFDYFITYLRTTMPPVVWTALVIVFIVGGPIMFLFRRHIAKFLSKHTNGLDFRQLRAVLGKRLGAGLLLLTSLSLSFLVTLMLLGQPITPRMAPTIMGMFVLSWMTGFLTPGAPGGLGVREAAMLLFLGPMMDDGIILSAIVIHRMIYVIGDVLAFGFAQLYKNVFKTREALR